MNLVWNRRADATVDRREPGHTLRDVRDVRERRARLPRPMRASAGARYAEAPQVARDSREPLPSVTNRG